MASSTTNLATVTQSQASKHVTINELFDAASPSTFGGRMSTSAGLTWEAYGGRWLKSDGTNVNVANFSGALTNNATNYLQITDAGVISIGASITSTSTLLYTIVTSGSVVTSYTDHRVTGMSGKNTSQVMTSTTTPLTLTAVHYGMTLFYSPAGSAAITLPANGATTGSRIEVVVLTDQTVTISSATADTLITRGDLTADSVEFSTASNKIGARVEFISTGTVWAAFNKSDCIDYCSMVSYGRVKLFSYLFQC